METTLTYTQTAAYFLVTLFSIQRTLRLGVQKRWAFLVSGPHGVVPSWAGSSLPCPGALGLGQSAPRTAPAGQGRGVQRRHDAPSLGGARSRVAGAAASYDPGNWLGALRTPCAQPPDLQPPGPRCRADSRRPGERASSPAVSGAAPLPLIPGSPAAAAPSPEPRPPGGGGRERERDLGSALGWPYPPRGPQFYCTPDPVRAVLCKGTKR